MGYHVIMWTKRVLLFFWICISFIFFTCFSALARMSSMMWKKRADNLTLFLNLMEKHLIQALNKSHDYENFNKHPLPTTQEKSLHMDITTWSTPKSDWLYSLQPKMEKLYTVSKNKTGSWLRLRPWTPYCQIQT